MVALLGIIVTITSLQASPLFLFIKSVSAEVVAQKALDPHLQKSHSQEVLFSFRLH